MEYMDLIVSVERTVIVSMEYRAVVVCVECRAVIVMWSIGLSLSLI